MCGFFGQFCLSNRDKTTPNKAYPICERQLFINRQFFVNIVGTYLMTQKVTL